MFWEDLVREWRRRSNGGGTPGLIAASGHAAVLAAPRRRRRPWLLLVLISLLVGAVALWLGLPRESTANTEPAGVTVFEVA